MTNIIARTYMGARDLFHGYPDLTGAEVVQTIIHEDAEDYTTTLVLRDVKGIEHKLIIKQAY